MDARSAGRAAVRRTFRAPVGTAVVDARGAGRATVGRAFRLARILL
ncbi:hypothetical protein [Kocuria rosea]|nr:hypothetical protein [Kocuria rosea]MCM3689071.1 hypothetical protein [Kocuria rosea]